MTKHNKSWILLCNNKLDIFTNNDLEIDVIELLKAVTLKKDDLEPITIEAGTLLKILMTNPSSYLVGDEKGFSFLINFSDENIQWKKI